MTFGFEMVGNGHVGYGFRHDSAVAIIAQEH
jgi:hypothetical protein